jgi:hypothetical protein
MYTCTDLHTRDEYRFRTLDSLARQIGGDHWQVEVGHAFRPPTTHIMILRTNRKAGGSDILTTVTVDTNVIEELTRLEAAAEELGDADLVLDRLARKLAKARAAEDEVMAEVRHVAQILVPAGRVPEAEFARRAGVNRMSVREWLGKR